MRSASQRRSEEAEGNLLKMERALAVSTLLLVIWFVIVRLVVMSKSFDRLSDVQFLVLVAITVISLTIPIALLGVKAAVQLRSRNSLKRLGHRLWWGGSLLRYLRSTRILRGERASVAYVFILTFFFFIEVPAILGLVDRFFLARPYNIHTLTIKAVYFLPAGTAADQQWKEKISVTLEKCKKFHEREFQGLSTFNYKIHPTPLIGEHESVWYQPQKMKREDYQKAWNLITSEVAEKVGYPIEGHPVLLVFSPVENPNWGGVSEGKGGALVNRGVMEAIRLPEGVDAVLEWEPDWASSIVYHEIAHGFGLGHTERPWSWKKWAWWQKRRDLSVMDLGSRVGLENTYIDPRQKMRLKLSDGGKLEYKEPAELVPEMYYFIGYSYLREGKYDDAIRNSRKAIELDPKYAQGYYGLGWAYWKKGLLDEATEEFKKAVDLASDSPAAHYALARIYYERGLLKDAEAELKVTMQLTPDSPLANTWLEKVYQKLVEESREGK